MMRMLTRRSPLGCLLTVLILATVLAGCENKQTGEALTEPPPSVILLPSVQPTVMPTVAPTVQPVVALAVQPTVTPIVQPTLTPTVQPSPTPFGQLFDPDLDLRAGPIEVPLQLEIPSLMVKAPVLGVGLTLENVMDVPKGPMGDPFWYSAFWYRGSGIPGEPGTATIAGHVSDPLGQPEIFAHIKDLKPGDLIIIRFLYTGIDIQFSVNQVKIYTLQEASKPAVLTRIFGAGPIAGTGPQPASDGLSHLTLFTCDGDFVDGRYDHYTVVYATRVE